MVAIRVINAAPKYGAAGQNFCNRGTIELLDLDVPCLQVDELGGDDTADQAGATENEGSR